MAALKNALSKFGFCLDVENIPIETLLPGETGCPQPISEESAQKCIQKRIFPYKNLVESSDDTVLFIAVENYLKWDLTAFYDRVLVMMYSNGGNWCKKNNFSDAVRVPDAYTAHLREQSEFLVNQIYGCKKTLGAMMHQDNPQCPSDDWFKFSPYYQQFDRKDQICSALIGLLSNFCDIYTLKKSLPVYEDFPTPGVNFKDTLPLMNPPHSLTLAQSMSDAVEACFLPQEPFLVGFESRGVFFASMLATHSKKWRFIACRYKGRLPRSLKFPIQSITYSTKNSTETLEIQPRHISDEMRQMSCILMDDFLATGSSLCAAANLLEQIGIKVSMVLVLIDVAPMKQVWKTAFANNKNLCNVPVRFVL